MRDETKYLLYYLPQLESTFSYACVALSVGMLSREEQLSFGEALIRTGKRLKEHAEFPVERLADRDYRPRCWVETPFDLHPDIVANGDIKEILDRGDRG